MLMIVYTQYMSKTSHKKSKVALKDLDPRVRFIVLPVLALVAVGAIVFAVITIANIPQPQGAQRGVGANGFRAFEEKDADLGVGKLVTREAIVEALDTKAKSVEDASVSTVINIDGNRGQTATYDFVKANGKPASIYIDITVFKSIAALDSAYIYTGTAKTDPINSNPAYYMHAQTIGSDREYRLMIVKAAKVYKFVLTQSSRDITINEVGAVATLKKIAEKSNL